MHWCLASIKHGTTRNILFPNIIWLQKYKFAQSGKIHASACSTLAMTVADVLLLVDFLYPEKCNADNAVAPAYNIVG